MESNVEKREFGFLWNIMGAYLLLFVINILIKNYVTCSCMAMNVSLAAMGTIGLLSTIFYAVKLKPAINQLLLFIVTLGFALSSVIVYVYDLACKNIVGFVSIPLILVFCGMWVYTKFAKTEV